VSIHIIYLFSVDRIWSIDVENMKNPQIKCLHTGPNRWRYGKPKQMSIQNTLLDLIDLDHFRLHSDHRAIVYDDGESKLSLSYGDFAKISMRLGTILQSMEVQDQVVSIAVRSQFLVPPMMIG
jgi:hypothetical protein